MNPAIINTLLKFNSGKNAKAITASGDGSALEPGVHAVSLKDVQRGGTFVPPEEVAAAMADLTQTTTASRKGAAVFGGSVVVEDCDGIRIGGFDMGKSNKR